jgi:hypothetical protein
MAADMNTLTSEKKTMKVAQGFGIIDNLFESDGFRPLTAR